MLFKIALLVLFIKVTFNVCNSICSTCLDQNSQIGSQKCTSCHSNYFLFISQCLDCNTCQSYGTCQQCQGQKQSIDNQQYFIIIFISLLSIIFIGCTILILYCKFCTNPVSNQAFDRNSSQVTMLELVVPNNLQWSKGDKSLSIIQSCAICLQINVNSQTKCHHLYHGNCIWEWSIKKEQNCPLCKSKSISPIKFYCSKCFINFIEINVPLMSKILQDKKWTICTFCNILETDFYQ